MPTKHTHLLPALVVAGLCLGAAPSRAAYLIDENFDDGAAVYTQVGTTNIRPTSDAIYTGTTNGFDSYSGLSGSFLVLGDNNGALAAGTPAGPVGNATGQISSATFNLGSFAAGSQNLWFAFDYVFDTSLAPGTGTPPTRSPDDFIVRLMTGTTQISEILRFDDVGRNGAGGASRGHFGQLVNFSLSTPGTVSLAFGLTEYLNAGDSAVGIDNLMSAVPEPDSMALLGVGLFGLAALRRRRSASV